MPRVKDQQFKTFKDGVLTLCAVKDRALTETKGKFRYGFYTIGYKRVYEAKIASETVDMMVKVPRNPFVREKDVCIIGGDQYEIRLVQDKFDEAPPYLLLTLSRLAISYKDVRADVESD